MESISKHMKSKLQKLARSPTSRGGPKFSSVGTPESPGRQEIPNRLSTASLREEEPEGRNLQTPTGCSPASPSFQKDPVEKVSRKRKREHLPSEDEKESGHHPDGNPPVLGVIPSITLEDMGGLQRELAVIKEVIEYPLRYGHLFSRLGADPPCGVLLHGPPGCGKTKLAHAIAGSLKVPLFFVSAPEIVCGISGDSEQKIRTLFMDAISVAPSIVFIDEIDTIAGRREDAQREMERRIVGQLLTCMDQLALAWRQHGKVVSVLGATNRPEAIDSALRRAGRFDREIALGIPTLDERKNILEVLTRQLTVGPDVNYYELANLTPGFVGADLHLLIKEASILSIRRIHKALEDAGELDNVNSEKLDGFCVRFDELTEAVKRVQPSAMREGFTTIPNVTWKDVGALHDVREELTVNILQPIRCPKLHKRFGLNNPVGVLLHGPPGCGKTLVAKAIASESGANFISIKGPELLNKFVGESERSVRMVFARGRASAPCVLFFDELDALAPRRGSDRANPSSERVVNQLLTELDGVEAREHVYVIAATNRPDMIDPAMLRPGRLDKVLTVPLPDASQRGDILKTIAHQYPLSEEIKLDEGSLLHQTEGFSGADLAALLREASFNALRDVYASKSAEELDAMERTESAEAPACSFITQKHFDHALMKIRPSVSAEDRVHYANLLK